ncbi:class I adenylate-forming enzyme family protein [Altererythrobacter sp. ZODW24]|uniref:class I adenylate-forming enzyme family protein n=1 Tax=Altererythrobacter sp. ZODW24 TaxID=2185142 RepID=UPI000DF7B081|nr:class I adenylate-forming enzyme family protein [Altererythrobacter sp. ZODW24]
MATELDNALNDIMDALIAPGAMFELETVERFGRELPSIKGAPPSLAHYFAHFCNEHKDATFIVDGDLRLTFGETYAAARQVAGGLVEGYGVERGDRIGIAARNSANWIVAYMAVIMAGGCATLLNGWWTGEELSDGIKLAKCKFVLADAGRAARLEGTGHGSDIVVFEHDGPPSNGLAILNAKGGDASTALPELGPDDVATILYTSGSTGQSKGAWSDHRGVVQGVFNYVAQTVMSLHLLASRGEAPTVQPSALVAVPLFHVTGSIPLFLQSFAIGRKLVMIPKWDAVAAMKAIADEKITYFVGVPLMSYEIATHPDRDQYDMSSCMSFAAGGAPRPVEHVTRIKEAFPGGFPLLGYGLTETNAVGCGNFNENYIAKPESTGRASVPLVDLAILDDDGNALAQGKVGEISIRSIANFRGYWENPEATASAIMEDGYFRTGDLGYLDEDGYLYIVDRKKDIIIRGGENISCIEVEQGIYAHEDIVECSCFGLPDERLGEVPAAVWYAKPGSGLTEEKLREFLSAHLAKFKIPQTMWEATEPLPRLGTEKIDKRTVRDQFAAGSSDG